MTEAIERREPLRAEVARFYAGTFAPEFPEIRDADTLPAGWEGLYFPFDQPLADLRADGSPAHDGVVPEIALPRRMYAGEDTEFLRPIRLGDVVDQRVSLGAVTSKTGRSGELTFVDVVREYSIGGEVAIRDVWHDVFLDVARPDATPRAPHQAPDTHRPWREPLVVDARQLFRFSALTLNTHRVHYDRSWATDVERLPDLLVHGPLVRLLLLDFLGRHAPDRALRRFSISSLAPVLVDRELRLEGGPASDSTAEILLLDDTGGMLARGTADWSQGS